MILEKVAMVTPELASENKLIAAVPMLSFRIFANCFQGGKGSVNAVSSNLLMCVLVIFSLVDLKAITHILTFISFYAFFSQIKIYYSQDCSLR